MITHKVILLLLAVMVPNPKGEYFTGFMVAQLPDMDTCQTQASIIENDFAELRKKEATMRKEDIEPRIKLVQSGCMVMPINLNLQHTGN